MSHLVEEYAKSLGVKIDKPVISTHFYPMTSNKYITINTDNKKNKSKIYEDWGIVFNIIKQYLNEESLEIIQVGGSEDTKLKFANQSLLDLTFKQISYIIDKSSLHIGSDGYISHVANLFNTPCITLYGDNYPECSRPIWNKEQICTDLFPDFSETKPSFSINESPVRINEIKPELIASSILDSLNIKHDLKKYNTLYIGHYYNNKITEVVPDFIPDFDFKAETIINLRCDYGYLKDSLDTWMKYKVNLMIDEQIDPNVIYENQKNIAGITIFLDKGKVSHDFLNFLDQIGLRYNLICKDEGLISDIRMKFFDYTVEEYKINSKKDVDITQDICDNTFYHSNKVLISKNKYYSSKAAWKEGVEKTAGQEALIDNHYFWEEIEYLNVYNYVKSKKKRRK